MGSDASAYLARIGVDAGLPPTLETLRRVLRVPVDDVPADDLEALRP